MKIRITTTGKVRQNFVKEGEAEYLKRLEPLLSIELNELEIASPKSQADLETKRREGSAFLKSIRPGEHLILLDERGKNFTSHHFAAYLEKLLAGGTKTVVFGIGGALGWSDEVRKEAKSLLSLSPLTFPYQLCRLVLIEQLYRAMTILKGMPYHKQ